jgi:hypothetical protein
MGQAPSLPHSPPNQNKPLFNQRVFFIISAAPGFTTGRQPSDIYECKDRVFKPEKLLI